MITALIFDFDGVILDTETSFYQTWQEIFQESGFQVPLLEWAAILGQSPEHINPIRFLEGHLGHPVDREKVFARQVQREAEILATETAMPGIQDYIGDAEQMGLKLGVASSSDRAWVTSHLSRLNLIDRFGCIKTSDDVANTKPDPDLYLSVLAGLDVQAYQAIAFEDSPIGIRAANRAKIFCVGVPNDITRHLPLTDSDLFLSSMSEVSLEELLARVYDQRKGK